MKRKHRVACFYFLCKKCRNFYFNNKMLMYNKNMCQCKSVSVWSFHICGYLNQTKSGKLFFCLMTVITNRKGKAFLCLFPRYPQHHLTNGMQYTCIYKKVRIINNWLGYLCQQCCMNNTRCFSSEKYTW